MLVDICLPVWNEEKILEKSCKKIFYYCSKKNYKFDWQIIILNNGSTDKTKEIAEKLSIKYHKIKLFNINKPGKGNALKTYWALSKADICSYMDIDLAVSLDNLDDLIFPIIKENFDLVIGSRLLPESKVNRSFYRSLSSLTYNYLSRFVLKHKFLDLQCGFKAAKTKYLQKYSSYIQDEKWFFDTELVLFFHYFACKIKEIPVSWQEQRYEKRNSKINPLKESIIFCKKTFALKKRIEKEKNNFLLTK